MHDVNRKRVLLAKGAHSVGERGHFDGEGRYIHTYMGDGDPLPSFSGEPVKVTIDAAAGLDAFADKLWNALNGDNKVSLFVRFIEIATGKFEEKIINKNK